MIKGYKIKLRELGMFNMVKEKGKQKEKQLLHPVTVGRTQSS